MKIDRRFLYLLLFSKAMLVSELAAQQLPFSWEKSIVEQGEAEIQGIKSTVEVYHENIDFSQVPLNSLKLVADRWWVLRAENGFGETVTVFPKIQRVARPEVNHLSRFVDDTYSISVIKQGGGSLIIGSKVGKLVTASVNRKDILSLPEELNILSDDLWVEFSTRYKFANQSLDQFELVSRSEESLLRAQLSKTLAESGYAAVEQAFNGEAKTDDRGQLLKKGTSAVYLRVSADRPGLSRVTFQKIQASLGE